MKESIRTAAALLMLGHVPYRDAKKMTVEQFLSLFEWHHGIPKAEGGPDEFWNLTPLLRDVHRTQTALIDVPRIAKNKRVQAKHAAHMERMAAKGKQDDPAG